MTSILEVKGDLWIEGLLHLESKFEIPVFTLLPFEDILNLCNVIVTLEADLTRLGKSYTENTPPNDNTFKWEQISPVPDFDVNLEYGPDDERIFSFEIQNNVFIDRVFRFYIDKDTPNEKFEDITVFATPNSEKVISKQLVQGFTKYNDTSNVNTYVLIKIQKEITDEKTISKQLVQGFTKYNDTSNVSTYRTTKIQKEVTDEKTISKQSVQGKGSTFRSTNIVTGNAGYNFEKTILNDYVMIPNNEDDDKVYCANTDYALSWEQPWPRKDNALNYNNFGYNTNVSANLAKIVKWTLQEQTTIGASWVDIQDFFVGDFLFYNGTINLGSRYRILTTYYGDYTIDTFQVPSNVIYIDPLTPYKPLVGFDGVKMDATDIKVISKQSINTGNEIFNSISNFETFDLKGGDIGGG